MEKYPHIFSPGRIGVLTAKNRVKYAATETNFPYGDGFVSDKEVAYMEAQARGGAGIVTTQGAYPDLKGEGKGFKGMMAIYDDAFIPGLARIADVIRKHGALSCLQILHCGREGGVELDYSLMASAVPQKLSYFKKPRDITVEEIKQSVKDHVRAARRGVDAGYDMIEISGIVGYLVSTFVSRYTNKRQDEYGGDIQSRCRLMVEVLQGIKAEVGRNFPVGIRLCGLELLDDRGGNTFEESLESFKIAEKAGADFVSVTIGWHESSQSVITRDVPMGHWLYVAEAVKKEVNVPVMMAFRQFLPEIPEKALERGSIDFWEACRPMIADPELPKKAREGREDEIIPCIACNLCFSRLYYHQPIGCSVRPNLGKEADPAWGYYGFARVKKPKKVVIVGGGPSGLQCASVAAARGHKVTLFEKAHKVGGSVLLAAKVDDGAMELLRPVKMLEGECRRNGVDIRLGVACTPDIIAKEGPQVVVLANGAGIRKAPYLSSQAFLTPEDIMAKGIKPPRRTVIIGGGGVGLGIAVFLLRTGEYDLTVIEEGTRFGRDVNPFYLWQYVRSLKEKKVVLMAGVRILGIEGHGIRLSGSSGEKVIGFDGIILAKQEPAEIWETVPGREIYYIGDAKRPRRINNAIHDGYRMGMNI
ncbi:MAG: FAD-dependent oxidoreductase [Syntrophobacterales bacterium]|jgi:2,4-dienoyl-CoA reductase (NADPH2)|nr:FAD-dependent oxidoreductase [Syntrophobacterales bacterium]